MTGRRVVAVAAPVVFGVVLLGLWEVLVTAQNLPPYILPAPSAIAEQVRVNFGDIRTTFRASGSNAVVGLDTVVPPGLAPGGIVTANGPASGVDTSTADPHGSAGSADANERAESNAGVHTRTPPLASPQTNARQPAPSVPLGRNPPSGASASTRPNRVERRIRPKPWLRSTTASV